ncbi:hypothetical protein [Mycobacterium sp. SMC-17]|uniref:hypothetical protein n=1 Tax=Mycobacterium sp. SMC-17 TaxID=3381628 RepID=UPI003876DCE3
MGIRKLALAVVTCVCVVAGCSTTTTGTARFGGSLSDPEPDVSQLRTGNYQIKPSTPFFSAGPNRSPSRSSSRPGWPNTSSGLGKSMRR